MDIKGISQDYESIKERAEQRFDKSIELKGRLIENPEEVTKFDQLLLKMLLEMYPAYWAEKRKSLVAFRRKNREIPTLKEVINRAEDTKKFYANPIKTVEFVKE